MEGDNLLALGVVDKLVLSAKLNLERSVLNEGTISTAPLQAYQKGKEGSLTGA